MQSVVKSAAVGQLARASSVAVPANSVPVLSAAANVVTPKRGNNVCTTSEIH